MTRPHLVKVVFLPNARVNHARSSVDVFSCNFFQNKAASGILGKVCSKLCFRNLHEGYLLLRLLDCGWRPEFELFFDLLFRRLRWVSGVLRLRFFDFICIRPYEGLLFLFVLAVGCAPNAFVFEVFLLMTLIQLFSRPGAPEVFLRKYVDDRLVLTGASVHDGHCF